jgi:hypothetical protein
MVQRDFHSLSKSPILPDLLLRQVQETAATQGKTVCEFVNEALVDKFNRRPIQPTELPGWRLAF